jgi:hypothetical protein
MESTYHLENVMKRTWSSLLALVLCGLALAAHDEPDKGKPK